jgi:hypothetical protein
VHLLLISLFCSPPLSAALQFVSGFLTTLWKSRPSLRPAWGEIMKRSVDDDGDRPMGYDRPTRA